jgi:hypothetical protein
VSDGPPRTSEPDPAEPEPADTGEDVPRDTAPEGAAADDVAEPGEGDTRTAGPLRAAREGMSTLARDSVAGVAAGSAALAHGSAALAHGSEALARKATEVTYWPAQLTVLAAILLQVRLPEKLTVGPTWLLPGLEGALLIGLAVSTPRGRATANPLRRRVAIGLIALVNAANAASLYLLAHFLLHKHIANGRSLILSGITIWLTNVLIFSLWYWELDRGGPGNRVRHPDPTTPEGRPDFLFTQMGDALPYTPKTWLPNFVDYLALSFTTATAFSPTDVLPLSSLAKILMAAQAVISLVTLGLIISRAVNILA